MAKKIWRRNFEIYRMPVIATGPPVFSAIDQQQRLIGKKILKDFLLIGEGYDLVGAYIPAKQLRDFVVKILEIIKSKPDFVLDMQKQGMKDVVKLFDFVKKNRNTDFKKMTDKQLADFHGKLQKYFQHAQGRLTLTTWFVDSDGEDFSRFLEGILSQKLKVKGIKMSLAEAFSILTTPDKPSMSLKEEIEGLKILKLIKADKKANQLFAHNEIKYIEDHLDDIDPKLKQKVISHWQRWLWLPYTYVGPAYDIDYYITMFSGLIRQGVDINKNLKLLENQVAKDTKARLVLIKRLGLKGKERKYFDVAADIIYLKAHRKDAWFYYCYLLEFVYKEVGRRLGLSLQQVRMMTFEEVGQAIIKGSFPAKILNQRYKKSAYVFKGKKAKVYAGKDADQFLATQNIEKEEIKEVDELSGTSARPGQAKGQVKVVNLPEEMSKMNKGDIMVARTTFPSLVPAMKKAAAIVTNDGGITCHAAIVARELKIPCVVGTKIATKVLKDGNRISVDATRGIIKKI